MELTVYIKINIVFNSLIPLYYLITYLFFHVKFVGTPKRNQLKKNKLNTIK
jgi:hypothetical protein